MIFTKEWPMRNKILAVAAISAVIGAPFAAQAQSDVTVGVTGGSTVVVGDAAGISSDQRTAFREYVTRERVPDYRIQDRVVIGGVLPEVGVTYYDVPQSFAMTPYRYTVVNGETVLVEPRTRRIVQIID
jgi:uncharacterized protein DUF1236